MSKRLSNSKRLQLINKWLRGIDDEDFEVFPCKTEGKYFVRPRKNKLKSSMTIDVNEEPPKEEKIIEPKVIEQPQIDPTVGNEILNQLKLLGEEIKSKREKKEQKKMIKEAVNKQINKQIPYTSDVIEPNQPLYRRRCNIFADIK